MLHFLFNCKPHQILMDLLLCLRDYPFSFYFFQHLRNSLLHLFKPFTIFYLLNF